PRELYDLNADPGEFKNIAEDEPERAQAMEAQLEEWIAGMMDRNGLTEDPLTAHGLTLGRQWKEPSDSRH
ncbi:MAG: hypothetical protein GWP08_18890, partial [Nitrospiraceae bacterium]|nr:hypothetical protein [Nitrospiraceae bacterium]